MQCWGPRLLGALKKTTRRLTRGTDYPGKAGQSALDPRLVRTVGIILAGTNGSLEGLDKTREGKASVAVAPYAMDLSVKLWDVAQSPRAGGRGCFRGVVSAMLLVPNAGEA